MRSVNCIPTQIVTELLSSSAKFFFYLQSYSNVWLFMAHQPPDLRSWLTLFFLILLSIGVLNAEELGFNREPQNVIVLKDQPFTWDCSAVGEDPINITWRKDGHSIENNGHHQVLRNGSLYFATVEHKKRKFSDEGIYECVASNSIGAIVSRAQLQVATKPRFIRQPEAVTANVGQNVRFSCHAESLPQSFYSWEKDRVSIPRDSSKYTILSSGILQIYNIQESDAGDYRCVAENIMNRRKSNEASLTVQQVDPSLGNDDSVRTPWIVAGPQNTTTMVGSYIVLECLVNKRYHDDPEPLISWSLEDGRDVLYGQNGNNLEISEVQTTDSGVYVCTAENPTTGEQVKARGKLYVHEPPTIAISPVTVTRPVAATARFICKVGGIPKPTITWLKNGKAVYLNGRIRTIGDELLISSIRNGRDNTDSGIYQCIAENIHGRVQASGRLKVIEVEGDGPSPPQNLRGFAESSTVINVTWDPSITADPIRSPVIAYTIHYVPTAGGRELQQAISGDVTTFLIGDLLPYTNYSFHVIAYTSRRAGQYSNLVHVMTLQDVPDESPDFTLSSDTPNSIRVTWEPLPRANRHGEITNYTIYYHSKSDPIATVTTDSIMRVRGDVHEKTIDGLQPNTIYNIKMSASTMAGEGPTSVYNTKKTADHIDSSLPVSPNLELININATAILIKWSMADDRSPVLGFYMYYGLSGDTDLQGPVTIKSDRTQYILGHLSPSTRYYVKLLAYNEHGSGNDVSGTLKTQAIKPTESPPRKTPMAPDSVIGEVVNSTSALIVWSKPRYTMEIEYYTIRYLPDNERNATFVKREVSNTEQILLRNLMPYTTYSVDVRAHGVNSVGPYSNAISVTTLEDKPSSPPRIVKVAIADVQSVLIQWAPPEHPNGIITTYIILYNLNEIEPEDNWMIDLREGSEMNSTIQGLQPSLRYYFKMKAKTGVGAGPATDAIAVSMPTVDGTTSKPSSGPSKSTALPRTGIIIGVSISLACIIICLAIIVYRSRKGLFHLCKPRTHSVPVPVCNGHIPSCQGNKHLRNYGNAQTEVELDSFTPMLSNLPEPTNLDTKGGNGALINGYGPVGFQGNGCLPQSCRLQHQLPGNSNTSIPVSTSSSLSSSSSPSSSAPSKPGGDIEVVIDTSPNTSQMADGNKTFLTDLSSCHSEDEEPPDVMATHNPCNAASHDTSSDTNPLPQNNMNLNLQCHLDLDDTNNINQQQHTSVLLHKSSTQGLRGSTGVNRCHSDNENDSSTSPLLGLRPAGKNNDRHRESDSGMFESNHNSHNTSSSSSTEDNTVWERRSRTLESDFDDAHLNGTHSRDCSISSSEHSQDDIKAELSNNTINLDNSTKPGQDTSPYFIELALNM